MLSFLKHEFADISVSKSRFLESEGLLTPERTASGYRKFSEEDLERLRTILRLQRDAFMPLRVIRERLAAIDAGLEAPPSAPAPNAPASVHAVAAPVPVAPAPVEEDEFAEPASVKLTEADLADATGLEPLQIKKLLEYGVLAPSGGNGTTYYDGEDLLIGKIAHGMLEIGLDPRHMKTLRRFAEQEADLYAQLVVPVLRNRRPEMRAQATDTLADLARLSRALRQTYLRRSLRSVLNGDR
ncbi:MAG: MerR family transcriptional regulator [Actinomycetota bacterium]